MKIGVVGANGFVGRSLCEKFISKGLDVVAFYNRDSSLIPEKCQKYSVSEILSVLDINVLIVSIGSHSSKHHEFVSQLFNLNNIISKINCNKVIFISSTSVYGENENAISVNSCFNNPNDYGLSKICQEFIVKSFNDYTIMRPTYIYGNGMNTNSLLPFWIKSAKENKEIVVFGDGKRQQDYLHIDDLTDLCLLSVLKPIKNNTVIAATGNPISNIEIVNYISTCVSDLKIKFIDNDNKLSSLFDIEYTTHSYNWTPKKSIYNWLKSNFNNEGINL